MTQRRLFSSLPRISRLSNCLKLNTNWKLPQKLSYRENCYNKEQFSPYLNILYGDVVSCGNISSRFNIYIMSCMRPPTNYNPLVSLESNVESNYTDRPTTATCSRRRRGTAAMRRKSFEFCGAILWIFRSVLLSFRNTRHHHPPRFSVAWVLICSVRVREPHAAGWKIDNYIWNSHYRYHYSQRIYIIGFDDWPPYFTAAAVSAEPTNLYIYVAVCMHVDQIPSYNTSDSWEGNITSLLRIGSFSKKSSHPTWSLLVVMILF